MKRSTSLILASLCAFTATPLVAQDGEVSGVQVLGISMEGGEFSPNMEGLAEASISFAGPGFGGGMSGGMFGGVNPNDRSQLFNLLANESVRSELKLTDQQYEGVQAVQKQSRARMQGMIKSAMSKSGNGRSISLGGTDFREMMSENSKAADEAIEEILLPEQLKRIRQLAYQVDIERTGLGESLINGRLGKDVGVYDNQKQSLTDLAARIDAETRQVIAQIKADAQKRLLASLAPEQRKEAEELLGDYFDYEAVSLEQQLQKSVRRMRNSAEGAEKEGKGSTKKSKK